MSDIDAIAEDELHAYPLGEEIANSVTHGVGVALSIAALVALGIYGKVSGDPWRLWSGIVFGIALVLEYSASTLYHALPQPRAKHVFKIVDHSGIYVLIAGSYTPFCLVTIRDAGGLWMFGVIWTCALAGIAAEAFWTYRPRWISAAVYLVMGWMVVFSIKPLLAALPAGGLWLLVAGGVCYSAGTVFYILKRYPYFHMIWHLTVLAASVCHFLAVLLFVTGI